MNKLIEIFIKFKDFIFFFFSIIAAIFGIVQFGKSRGKEELKNDINQKTLKNVDRANEIRKNNSKLTRNELIDKL